MTSFPRDPRLDLYSSSSNMERVAAIRQRSAAPQPPRKTYVPGLSVVILNLDRPDLLLPLCRKFAHEHAQLAAAGQGFEVIVGDTGSRHPEVLAFYENPPPYLRVERNLRYHFSRSNNTVFHAHVRYDKTLFLNNDIVPLAPDAACFLRMAEHLDQVPADGVVGHTLWFADERVQHAGVDFFRGDHPLAGLCYHPGSHQPVAPEQWRSQWSVPAVTGACLMIRSALFAEVGGFDEDYAAECQDVDLCLAVRRLGYDIRIINSGKLYHLENATRPKGEENWPDRHLLVRRWGSFVAVGGA